MEDSEIQRRLGVAISAVRRARGLTQEGLAEAVGASSEWISRVERGVGAPSLVMMVKLCVALEVGAGELLDGATAPGSGRPGVQELLSISRDLPDGAIAVLVAAARELQAQRKG